MPETETAVGIDTAPSAEDGASRLLYLATLAEELGAEEVSAESRELATRVSEGRFYVACVGQFKRGKSTLINALIGQPILPTGFIPVTAVPTVIRFGDRLTARIRTREGLWHDILISDLKNYVTEELNPENQKGVQGAEVFVPSSLLFSGMCIVDTPGLGSVFAANTAATQALIPHIDAALVVVGADPPLAGEELALVEAVGKQVRELILVLNKADRTTDAEREAASKFTRQLLHKKLRREVGPVFEISAQERAENRGPDRDWRNLVDALQALVDDSGRHLVRAACERGLERVSEQVLAIIGAHKDALRRPIAESERRITAIKQTVAEAERSMHELSFLFMAEQQRISDLFVDRRKAFLLSVLPKANEQLEEILRSTPSKFVPTYRRYIMKAAQQFAHDSIAPWLKPEQEEAEREYRRVATRFVEMGNDFLHKLAEAGIPELARMPHPLDPEAGFRVRSQFTFIEFTELAQPASPLRWLADVLLPLVGAGKLIQDDARQFLARLIETNTARVQSDILNRVQESRGWLEVEIRKLLHEVSRIAAQALVRARKLKAEGEPAVKAELARLDELARQASFLAASPETGARSDRHQGPPPD
ncbi:MAG TPA: dynamin family protein [Silvibacterium sp.]|nr:dynamin family protein [Silvibacterium sp.]